MPICPKCGNKSHSIGVLCPCTSAYMIHEGQPVDPLGLLGKQVAKKLVLVGIYDVGKVLVAYEAWQSAVERMVTLLVMRPEYSHDEHMRYRFMSAANIYSLVHQQNLPMLFEVLVLDDGLQALMCDVRRGEPLTEFLSQSHPDDVLVVHIIHQILQGLAAYHRYNICVPNICYDHIRIIQSGGDAAFVKFYSVMESLLATPENDISPSDDVWCVAQFALSLLTGQPIPITDVELSEERSYLSPIVQLFMHATAPVEERYSNADALLMEFETILDVRQPTAASSVSKSVSSEEPRVPRQKKNLVEFKQIIWMHSPPRIGD